VIEKRENGKIIFKIKGKITTIHSIFIRLTFYFITFQEGKAALGELTILSLFIWLLSNTLSFVDNSPKNLRKIKL
jgi:hypothetical protein